MYEDTHMGPEEALGRWQKEAAGFQAGAGTFWERSANDEVDDAALVWGERAAQIGMCEQVPYGGYTLYIWVQIWARKHQKIFQKVRLFKVTLLCKTRQIWLLWNNNHMRKISFYHGTW